MDMTTICRLETQIASLVRDSSSGASTHFTYEDFKKGMFDTAWCRVVAWTRNPRHGVVFQMHSEEAASAVECLEAILKWVTDVREPTPYGLQTYKIWWALCGQTDRHVSVFNGMSFAHVMRKFYAGGAAQENKFVVWKTELQPES